MLKPYRNDTIAWMLTAASILMFFVGCRTQSAIEADQNSWLDSAVSSEVGRPGKVKSGYPDVVTDRFSIEVECLANWKEGLGQAYAYAIDTEKMPVLALVRPIDWTDFAAANYAGELRTRYAAPLGIRVWVLVPTGEGVAFLQ